MAFLPLAWTFLPAVLQSISKCFWVTSGAVFQSASYHCSEHVIWRLQNSGSERVFWRDKKGSPVDCVALSVRLVLHISYNEEANKSSQEILIPAFPIGTY